MTPSQSGLKGCVRVAYGFVFELILFPSHNGGGDITMQVVISYALDQAPTRYEIVVAEVLLSTAIIHHNSHYIVQLDGY